jgi:hypothetical protein
VVKRQTIEIRAKIAESFCSVVFEDESDMLLDLSLNGDYFSIPVSAP